MGDAALRWPTGALAQGLSAAWPGARAEALAEVGSTNTEVMQRLRANRQLPALLMVAETQTAGRGRHGRRWQSAPGASLTFTLGLQAAPVQLAGLSLAVGVALAETLDPGPAPRLQLKWPNDLWLADGPGQWRKLGGILIETVMAGERRSAVIGIGLNLRPLPATDEPLAMGQACVNELDPAADAPGLLLHLMPPLVAALQRFEREGLAPFLEGWRRRDLLAGRAVSLGDDGAEGGVVQGVDAQGALHLRQGGVDRFVHGGEVRVRPLPEPQGA